MLDSRGADVGFYSQVILPRICHFMMNQSFLATWRRELLTEVSGRVLEIGFGTGLNLPFYPEQVRRISAIEPNLGMFRQAKRLIERSGIDVELHAADSQHLPFAYDAFDCVVSTWTLCSIDDLDQALREVHRVLAPGGRFLFLEHGLSREPQVQKWQRRFNGLQMRLAGGCRLDRDMRAIVSAQPFSVVQVDEFYLGTFPKTHSYMYRGSAVK